MSVLHRHAVHLSKGQKQKLRTAYRKQRNAVIGLTNKNIGPRGKDFILLNGIQHEAIKKARKNKTGLRLNLSYDQLLKNKQGGLLKEVLEIMESKIPGGRFISPLVRKNLAPMLKDKFIPWLKKLIDHELDTIIERDPQGAGLKRRINKKLDELILQKNL